MNEFEVIGMKVVDFVGSDGKKVAGMTVWLSYQDENIKGIGVEKVWIPADKVKDLSIVPDVGVRCRIVYNRYGKVADLVEC